MPAVSNESIGSVWHAGHGEKRPGSGTPQHAQWWKEGWSEDVSRGMAVSLHWRRRPAPSKRMNATTLASGVARIYWTTT
jgi:hypothetical protein